MWKMQQMGNGVGNDVGNTMSNTLWPKLGLLGQAGPSRYMPCFATARIVVNRFQ
ncbi:hypothetical protein SAMD00023353_6800290 [Rosellinia necatrix]|uniref:Uncharacterized protein n=1 Tax=Rosellinia necatrix TaxID=77044 RepID=A0A1S8AAG8_ROSNE|nr:hypothetical protein SAMD00023353_6800290 [Rosellinia necatrix]